MNLSTFLHHYGDIEWLTAPPAPAPSEVEVYTISDWDMNPLIIVASIAGSTDPYRWPNRHVDIGGPEIEHGRNGVASFAGPTPTEDDNEVTSPMAAPLEREDDPEFCGYGVTTSPVTSDTDSLPELRFTPAVKALPKASRIG